MAISLVSTGISFPDGFIQTSGIPFYNNIEIITTTSTWTVPTGVTSVLAIAIGGGGGGSRGHTTSVGTGDDEPVVNAYPGGRGGIGGAALKIISTSPGASASVTIGNGGAGSNSSNGTAGSTTSLVLSGVTISGSGGGGGTGAFGSSSTVSQLGVNGADGTGTNGDLNTTSSGVLNPGIIGFFGVFTGSLPLSLLNLTTKTFILTTGTTSAQTWTTNSNYSPGAGGQGEISAQGNQARGGSQGSVFILYKS